MGTDSAERRAVVVEDDADMRSLLARTLQRHGFDVALAGTGAEGLRMVGEHRPDLVTLDLNLPDLDGTEVCRRIRAVSDAYVMMITGRADEIDELMGLQIGADDYISKPFSPRTVQARVEAMFRRPRTAVPASAVPSQEATVAAAAPAPGGSRLAHGALEVDVDARLVLLDGEELALTRTEFDLLVLLIGAPRRVWTREMLLRSVWGDEWASDEHLVEVHVGNLRRKLGDRGKAPRFIRTVRGVGYGMVAPAG
ncbi:response regulator transcription factor [Sinomonas atrocyanea]|jgi:DNA-binding response OmpR family regulator|uniref:response regulator transcription factor n=1 Tax=Sinomonas atrocyanea TaxID=37927 RepID=UPI002856ECE4|nr:response regulator transcription factor [Sinomonas atrocyanea]MDR6622418.1 DNA-binding response OmpR family regulator [Sinomonas atrocyanea]